ncbi:siderophore iron transporter mirA [Verticillium alfalfae VaMs.102]|uniref:Siderophore iron transporter mirA n=1 Tax=Verticillium alfalfae (strain VaMs.102 / ATCC MYA-4576 / FGSC 10136) TaxID=526221 RepID=C9ST31_VERA1|nr:siderophore iron transporter mirA [Verticillium alfalfae VaMs.102]EEY21946.1 siderophore iron transporter mirA [Verticillium alfalfae VaMs.102]
MAASADQVTAVPNKREDAIERNKGNIDQQDGLVPGDPSKEQEPEQPMAVPTEAMRKIWSIRPLVAVFVGMIFAASSAGVYDPYVTSHFEGHSLIATANIIHGIVRIVGYPLLAKVADSGGIFESFGDTWWTITEQIFIADVTSLVNRGFLFTLPQSLAAIPTLYAGTYLGEHMLLNSTWRWGFGMWAVIIPFCALPTIAIMLFMEHRGRKKGIKWQRLPLRASSGAPQGSSFLTQLYYVVWVRLDIMGAFLLLAGLSMTLLPLSITGRRNTERWTEASSIVLIIMGVLTFVAFLVWDGRFAKNPIVPFRMIKNRNVLLACVSVCLIAMSDSTYRAFGPSFLQVAGGYSPGHAVRIDNARRVALNLGGLVIGIAIRFVKHTKPFIIIGCVMVALANGLPIYFTNIDGTRVANEAALTTSQVLLGLGRGFAQIPLQVSLQAVVPDHEVGIATALFLSSSGFGANVGNSVSGAIWNTILPRRLLEHLPEAAKENSRAIFRSIVAAQSFAIGTPERSAINLSYRQTQQTLAIASLSISIPLLLIMLLIRNVDFVAEEKKKAQLGRGAGRRRSCGKRPPGRILRTGTSRGKMPATRRSALGGKTGALLQLGENLIHPVFPSDD